MLDVREGGIQRGQSMEGNIHICLVGLPVNGNFTNLNCKSFVSIGLAALCSWIVTFGNLITLLMHAQCVLTS